MSHFSVEKKAQKNFYVRKWNDTKKIIAVSNKFPSQNVTNFTKMFIFSVNISEGNLEGKVDEKSMSNFGDN